MVGVTLSAGFRKLTGLPDAARARVQRLEAELLAIEQRTGEVVDCPVEWLFAPGQAVRKMTIPAGVVLTGAVHRAEHVAVVARGRIRVTTDDGVRELVAGDVFVSPAGTKRAGYAVEETVFVTFHATDTRDVRALVAELTESVHDDLLDARRARQLAARAAAPAIEGEAA